MSRRIKKLQLRAPSAFQPINNLPIGLIPLRQLIMRNSHHIFTGIHAADEIGFLHVPDADVEGPRYQRRVLVVIYSDRVGEGVC
jgi:hypothetical protein